MIFKAHHGVVINLREFHRIKVEFNYKIFLDRRRAGNAREAMLRQSLRSARERERGDQRRRRKRFSADAAGGDGSTSNESRRANDDKTAILFCGQRLMQRKQRNCSQWYAGADMMMEEVASESACAPNGKESKCQKTFIGRLTGHYS